MIMDFPIGTPSFSSTTPASKASMYPVIPKTSSIDKKHIYRIKICFIGNVDVGKTSLFSMIKTDTVNVPISSLKKDPTIGLANDVVDYDLGNNKVLQVHLYDTAGQERFRSIIQGYLIGSYYIVCVFDITSRDSFEALCTYWFPWIEEKYRGVEKKARIVIVANKIDLVGTQKMDRFADKQAIMASLTQKLHCKAEDLLYFEVSAVKAIGVAHLVNQLVTFWIEENERLLEEPEIFAPARVPVGDLVNDKKSLDLHKVQIISHTPPSTCSC